MSIEEAVVEKQRVDEDVKQASRSIIDKAKKKRGRPKKDSEQTSSVGMEQSGDSVPIVDYSLSPTFQSSKNAVKVFYKMVSNLMVLRGTKRAFRITGDKDFANDFGKSEAIPDEDIMALSENGGICVEQYGLGSRHAALFTFGVMNVTMFSRWGMSEADLMKIAVKMNELKKANIQRPLQSEPISQTD